ncbi:MAG: dihydrolipoyl dehydrogenase [Bdellovibrio sp. CG12_big_fil_rev_8_21_14_0_65_39_13]|nr:MAG: dihydrolipoyl dehydrogenase [Bdellovibrio sp. CG12_big_fil_rev_8_21_14_0_65_39_13]PIR35223.1 MAG: dihydrolipoyl dehydrogenase [Bdellovibrio sp. CG11_big_fil_rev_8_21_14_0_20_39_38]
MKKMLPKMLLITFIGLLIYIFKHYGLSEYLTLGYIKQNQAMFQVYYSENTILSLSIFFIIYVVSTALSLPGATVLTLAAGALFGLVTGTLIVSFASTIGATLAFLSSRFLLRGYVEKKFKKYIDPINQGIEKDGAFYLFTLRLIPIFPFFVINLVMGITKISTLKYFIVSQIGMLAGTIVYVNAGLQLGNIDSLSGILSFKLMGSFALLGIFPLIAKKIVNLIKANKVYTGHTKPKKIEYNMVVIGAGSAGLVTAYISAAVKAKVALIEKHKMGGDCLNTGCVPSKAIIKSAKLAHQMKNASKYGLEAVTPKFEFKNVMNRVHDIISKIEPHDSVERYSDLGVECIQGAAKIISPWEVEVDGKVLTTQNITIATGASPFVPPIPGLDQIIPLTSENLWQLEELPKRMIILGGGPIGCEMAQSFNRLGSQVTQVEMMDRIMGIEDPEVSSIIEERFKSEGVNVLTKHKAKEIKVDGDKKYLVAEFAGQDVEIEFDEILVAVGRRANIKGFGAEELGITLRQNQTIDANEYLQTNFPNIYVCGDVTGPFQLTHTASHQAWFCAVNALFGKLKKFKVDYSVIPWATYSDPEVASVGLNEQRAKREGIPYELTTYGIDDLDRAIADSEDHGVVRVLTEPGSDKILGATIVGNHASDLLLEFIAAMKHGFGLNKILGTIHIYPTMGEANKYLAGNWKRKQTSETVFKWLKRFHVWNR